MCVWTHTHVMRIHTCLYGGEQLKVLTVFPGHLMHTRLPCVLVKTTVTVIRHHDQKQSSVGSPGSRHLLSHKMPLSPFPTLYRREKLPVGAFYRPPQPLGCARS